MAALQGALQARGVYDGAIDGLRGPRTQVGVVRAQRRVGLVADGVVGPMTRRALRLRGLGVRTLRHGSAGADVVFSGEGEVALAFTEAILENLGATPEQIQRERARVHAELA